MRFAVYLIRCSISGKGYVGKTSDPAKRWRDHKWNATAHVHARSALYAAIRKYGAASFTFEVVEWCDSEALAFEREKHWIADLGTFGSNGYNMTDGGEGMSGARHTPESKALLAAGRRGTKASPETRAKMSASHRGKRVPNNSKPGALNPFFGRTHSEETKALLSEKAKLRPSPTRGRKSSPEELAAMSLRAKEQFARLGHPRLGKRHSAESRAKMSEGHKGRAPWQRQRAPWRKFMPTNGTVLMRLYRAAKRDDDLADRFVDVSPMDFEEDRHDW